jgi:hypothetical protein
MSKANSPIKVLKTAIKRLNKGWTKATWSDYDEKSGQVSVCLEGAIFGFCENSKTQAQRDAIEACEQIIFERWNDGVFMFPNESEDMKGHEVPEGIIPRFNDSVAQTADEMVEICKLAIIRLETGGPIDDDEFIEFDPDGEELADLLPKKN